MTSWKIQGEYIETCNCTFLCPCITSNLAAEPTEGECKAAIAMHIDKGSMDGVDLNDLAFVVVLHAPGVMLDGNIKVGVIIDDRASDAQVSAITNIASGAAGGPMAALGPLVGEFAGVEKRPIAFNINGLNRSIKAGDLIEQAIEGIPSATKEGEAICLDNTAHPVSPRLSLAKATSSHMHAFGINWDDVSGSRNGHFASYVWSN